MYTKTIRMFGKLQVLACDGLCEKAWGISCRPKVSLSDDPDDIAYLADTELSVAPSDPGTYEGGCAKPCGPHAMNKWCTRECERSDIAATVTEIVLPDYRKRRFNQPHKHKAPSTLQEQA